MGLIENEGERRELEEGGREGGQGERERIGLGHQWMDFHNLGNIAMSVHSYLMPRCGHCKVLAVFGMV